MSNYRNEIVPHITRFPLSDDISLVITECLYAWGTMDACIENLRAFMVTLPSCASVEFERSSAFNKRLNHFEKLCSTHFSTCDPLLFFCSETIKTIRDRKRQRDLLAHGEYYFYREQASGLITQIILSRPSKGGIDKETMSTDQFVDIPIKMAKMLDLVFVFSGKMPPFGMAAISTRLKVKPTQQQAEMGQTLLGPIQAHHLKSIVQQSSLSIQPIDESNPGVWLSNVGFSAPIAN